MILILIGFLLVCAIGALGAFMIFAGLAYDDATHNR